MLSSNMMLVHASATQNFYVLAFLISIKDEGKLKVLRITTNNLATKTFL